MTRDRATTIPQPLGDGLILRTAENGDDVARVAALNAAIHGETVGALSRELFLHHPHTQLDDLILVEDEGSKRVVSTLCLIPWTWRYEGVELPAGEMGIVATDEAYRQRGLIRAQVALFERRLREGGYLLSHIQGIPYFYRQFGYTFALPLEGGLRLETRHVPEPPASPYTVRAAGIDDVPTLMQHHAEAARDLAIHAARDEATWRYMLTHAQETEMARDTWLLEDPAGQSAGYYCIALHPFGEELAISECSRLSAAAGLTVLDHAKGLALERSKPGIRLNLPAGCALLAQARALGGHDLGTYAWQIHVPDFAALLRHLAPALERRLEGSAYAGLTRQLTISLYREKLVLRFEGGALAGVDHVAEPGAAPIGIPPSQFVPLVLGHRTAGELRTVRPDVIIARRDRPLIDTLFPKRPGFIYTIY